MLHVLMKGNGDVQRIRSVFAARQLAPFVDLRQVRPEQLVVMTRAEGMRLWDSEGNCYLDGISGLFCNALGYGREELVEAASRQLRTLSFCNPYFNIAHPAAAELSERLFAVLPEGYARVAYCNSGSEANETLIRTVRRYWDVVGRPKKKAFISRVNGYHGSTLGSASLGGFATMHEMGDLPLAGFHHIGEPYWFACRDEMPEEEFGLRAARELEDKILELGPERVAAFVAEPFQAAGGFIFPPATYWPEIQRICRKYDVLLCVDEVVGGFGRTGAWFSFQLYGIEPDTISIAKGLTSGHVPMGGLILSRRIAEAIVAGGLFPHVFTNQAHPLACAVASATLELLGQGGVVERVRSETGPHFQRTLREAFSSHPLVGEVQGVGAAAALQLAPSKTGELRCKDENLVGAYCMQSAFEAGLICRSSRGRIILAPALTATCEELDEIVHRLRQAVDRTACALGMFQSAA